MVANYDEDEPGPSAGAIAGVASSVLGSMIRARGPFRRGRKALDHRYHL